MGDVTSTSSGRDGEMQALLAPTPSGFDENFIAWWVMPGEFPDQGEASPHADLASFKAMLDLKGWRIVRAPQGSTDG